MTVLAGDQVTLAVLPAVTYTRTYYQLRASNLSVPPVPSTNPPPGPWRMTEPSYSEGSTDTLYTVALTAFGDTDFEYGPVQVSSSYEAAKAAYNKAVSVLSVASGKNTLNFSTTTPPTTGNANRVIGDIWWRRSGTVVIGQWMWTGTAWTETPLRDEVIASLSLGKLVAGSGTINEVVAQKIWSEAVLTNFLEAERIVSDEALIDGAVTSRTLNVVPEEGTGGVEILPPGISIIPSGEQAGTAISLRIDEPNWIAFAQDGETLFSVSPEGHLVSQEIYADKELYYKAEKLSDILDARPRGVLAFTKMTQPAIVGTVASRLVMSTIETPVTPRAVKLIFGFHRQSAERMQITFRQSVGTTVSNANSIQNYWYIAKTAAATADYVEIAHIIPDTVAAWGAGNTVTFGFFAQSMVSGNTITFDPNHGVTMLVEDIGPAVEVTDSVPYVPSTGGGTGQGSDAGTTKKTYTKAWNSTGHRTYSYTGLSSTRASQSLVQGYMAGANSRGHWLFNDADIRSNLAGATLVSGTLTIRNQHSYSGSGMTAVVRSHGYSSAPSTFGSSNPWTSVHVPKGGSVSLPLTASLLSALASGSVRGFSLDHGGGTSTEYYGYFSPTATLSLTYKK